MYHPAFMAIEDRTRSVPCGSVTSAPRCYRLHPRFVDQQLVAADERTWQQPISKSIQGMGFSWLSTPTKLNQRAFASIRDWHLRDKGTPLHTFDFLTRGCSFIWTKATSLGPHPAAVQGDLDWRPRAAHPIRCYAGTQPRALQYRTGAAHEDSPRRALSSSLFIGQASGDRQTPPPFVAARVAPPICGRWCCAFIMRDFIDPASPGAPASHRRFLIYWYC